METIYRKATPELKADLIDFGNFVFSQSSRPHDFKTLLPKMYGDNAIDNMESCHYVALQDGKIKGMVAALPIKYHVLGEVLNMRFVGTVSTHPYSRGEGHMIKTMEMMINDAKDSGVDILALGGQRQRYNYYGFEKAGIVYYFGINGSNIRHAYRNIDASGYEFVELKASDKENLDFCFDLYSKQPVYGERPKDKFLEYMHSWNSSCKVIFKDGERIGYSYGNGRELMLVDDEKYLLPVIKALYNADKFGGTLEVPSYCTERIKLIRNHCEVCHIQPCEMIYVINWERVLNAFFGLALSYRKLDDGKVTVKIDDEIFSIEVTGGRAAIAKTNAEPQYVMTSMEAKRRFFALDLLALDDENFHNWLPLPFYMNGADTF